MISIVIPVYNSAETLMESYESVLNSGVEDQEIIFVDDGSTDHSLNLIASIQDKNPNVILVKNQQNLGGGATRNRGVKFARHPIIFILDSDDILAPGALKAAHKELMESGVDAIATSKSVVFTSSIGQPTSVVTYKPGLVRFEDLISHTPTSATINLLFYKKAFDDVGGYPENHGFDTQGFGFRLLRNQKKVIVGTTFLYYQRVPLVPSYYAREARAGNINRNWFYIFFESLYKFTPEIRSQILNFPYSDPVMLAKGMSLFNVLANIAPSKNIFCKDGLKLDDGAAYTRWSREEDFALSAWCFSYEIEGKQFDKAIARFAMGNFTTQKLRILFPFLSKLLGTKLSQDDVLEFIYFFGTKKNWAWKLKLYRQKFINRLSRLIGK